MTDLTAERAAELDELGMGYFYAASISPIVSMEASRTCCIDHPNSPSHAGFGYAGGGFGPYLRCDECHVVFGKRSVRDGNENQAIEALRARQEADRQPPDTDEDRRVRAALG